MTRRLLLGYVAIILVLVGLLAVPFGLVFAQRQRDLFAVALERDAVVLATVYEDALQESVRLDPAVAESYAEQTGARVVVVDAAGVSDIDTEDAPGRSFATRPEIVTALAGNRYSGTRYSGTLEVDLFVSAVPVASGHSVFGAVRVTVLNGKVESAVRRMWLSLVLVVVVAIAASAAVALAVARSVTRPVAHLSASARRIASGDLTARADIEDAPPELDQLAEAFNDMATRLERLVARQRSFVADASHQLRTPLTALRLRIDNLEASASSGSATREAKAIRIEVERLSRMVDQLLELSKAGSAVRESVEATRIVGERCAMWKEIAAERSIDLGFSSHAEMCLVEVVPGGLEQIMDNLLDNAVLYSNEGGSILVELRRTDVGDCELEVTNSGEGVAPDDLDRIFDRFWRGSSDAEGSGLGLAIVAYLVARSGGEVTASIPAGGGLSVVIVLRQPTASGARGLQRSNGGRI